ncbi:MAG: transposase [Cyanobacteria bacterium P01_D01_bin.1]
MYPLPIGSVPEQTALVAKAAFSKGNPYLTLRDELGSVFEDSDFEELFATVGQQSLQPWRTALVTILQFRENLSDRQAADAVRSRIDWKYLLGLELTDEGFSHSVLSEFRKRLIDNGQEQLLLDKLLLRCKERGLLKKRGQQRTDATRVLASIRKLNRLELVGETMRAALNELATVAPDCGYQRLRQKRGMSATSVGLKPIACHPRKRSKMLTRSRLAKMRTICWPV